MDEFDKQIFNISQVLGIPSSEGRKIIYKLLNEPYEYSLSGLYQMVMQGKDIRTLL